MVGIRFIVLIKWDVVDFIYRYKEMIFLGGVRLWQKKKKNYYHN